MCCVSVYMNLYIYILYSVIIYTTNNNFTNLTYVITFFIYFHVFFFFKKNKIIEQITNYLKLSVGSRITQINRKGKLLKTKNV